MVYVFHMLDRPAAAALRQRRRPLHKAYLAQVAERIAFAGSRLHEDGVTMLGSLLAIGFDNRAAARAWLVDEPFTSAGLCASVEIHALPTCGRSRRAFRRRHERLLIPTPAGAARGPFRNQETRTMCKLCIEGYPQDHETEPVVRRGPGKPDPGREA